MIGTTRPVAVAIPGGPYLPPDHRERRSNPHITAHGGGWSVKRFSGSSGKPVATGGIRGEICGFSPAARRRLRVALMRIDWRALDCQWVTLTYHNAWGDQWQDWKAQLRAFQMRLDRRWGSHLGDCWRLEFQRRGAPHFHMIVCWRAGKGPDPILFGRWVRRAWSEITGAAVGGAIVDRDAWKHGTRTVPVSPGGGADGIGRLLGYMVKELGKVQQSRRVDRETGEITGTGRVWGVRGDLPTVEDVTLEMDEPTYARLLERINAHGRAVGSWYLGNVSDQWAGFCVLGDRSVLASEFLTGLNYTVVGDARAGGAGAARKGSGSVPGGV